MKNRHVVAMLVLLTVSISSIGQTLQGEPVLKQTAYLSFGENINDRNVTPTKKMTETYNAMKVGDTVSVKTTAKVVEVCQSKGCWMTLTLDNGQEAMVKFKDYAFFMPKDISGKDVILNGKAYVNEVPVDEQRHYAEDAGKSKEDIAAITMPKKTFSFEADGVLIKK